MDGDQGIIAYIIQEININLKHSKIQQRFYEKINKFSPKDKTKINEALAFATKKHEWVYRRDNVTPYIYHPILVSSYTMEFGNVGVDDVCACILHDVLEDTPTPSDEIQRLFGEKCCQKVLVLSKNFDDKQLSIEEYVEEIVKDKDSIRNKSCDIFANSHGSIFLGTDENKNNYLERMLTNYAPIINQTEKYFPKLHNLIMTSIRYSQKNSITEDHKKTISFLLKQKQDKIQ